MANEHFDENVDTIPLSIPQKDRPAEINDRDDFKPGDRIGQKKLKDMPKYMQFLISFGAAITIFLIAMLVFNHIMFSPVNGGDKTAVLVEIESGSSVSKIATILEEKGLIRNKTIFKFYVDFSDSASIRSEIKLKSI